MKGNLDQSVQKGKSHLSKVDLLDRLMSAGFDGERGPRVPLPEVIALGIGPYSRRFQDLRKRYKPLGFDVVNELEYVDGVTHSFYRKIRIAFPTAEREPSIHQSPQIHKARKSPGAWRPQPIIKTKSFEEWDRDRKQPKTEPEWSLIP